MGLSFGGYDVMFGIYLWLLLGFSLSFGSERDILCLKSIKDSLEDPLNSLSPTWDFNNRTEGFICRFAGVECWHPDENKVLNLKLSQMGLKGQFPRGVENCASMTGLDLSYNTLTGVLPLDIDHILPLVTSLDLSHNAFTGPIPTELSNSSYLNDIKLNNNQFSGQIPAQLGQLGRLKVFSVANNLLTGPIPKFNNSFQASSFENNPGLCGDPLESCKSNGPHVGVIAGAAVGGVTFGAIFVCVGIFYYTRKVSVMRKTKQDPDENKWAKSFKKIKGTKVSMFVKSISKMKLGDLMKATDNFNKENIIGSGRSGTVYRAVIEDGTELMVKRLQDSQHSEKEFVSEMDTLGKVSHRNLVPLLGYCMAKNERLLVYKYMSNGTLHDCLHVDGGSEPMEWPIRLKIAIGAARGLAWLHHNCNPRIIHRNISSKSILLDEDYEPKISDFGLARLMNPLDTHLSTFVNGDFGDVGYVAPEYTRTLVATPKGDVYSFGTVLLELVTGEKPTHVARDESFKGNLVEWVTKLSSDSKLQDAADKSFVGKGYDSELQQFLRVACRCILLASKERPTMFEVYQLLRAVGERYNFTVEDELMAPSDTTDAGCIELIVAQ